MQKINDKYKNITPLKLNRNDYDLMKLKIDMKIEN